MIRGHQANESTCVVSSRAVFFSQNQMDVNKQTVALNVCDKIKRQNKKYSFYCSPGVFKSLQGNT